MKVLIKHFKKSGLAPETMLRTQRSRPFFNLEKTGHFWHFINGGNRMKNWWKAEILEMAESDIFYVK